MTAAPLAYTVVNIVGYSFTAIWTPEDGALRAAGFSDSTSSAAAKSALRAGEVSAGAPDPLIHRLAKRNPRLAARGLAAQPDQHSPIANALRAYAAGDLAAIETLTVAQPETPFRGEVWQALRRIPHASTATYSELAAMAGQPTAVRAAASGCANNLVAIVVPCHRIVRTDGGLGGYLFGVEVKELLLRHEGAIGN